LLPETKKWVICFFIAISIAMSGNRISFAQENDIDSLLQSTLYSDSLLLEELVLDSITILDLIDSLISTDFRYSSLVLRMGYISDIVNAGRDFGINQYGFSAGMSYYHKSGLFSDITGYWNSDMEPKYNPTIVSLGYLGSILPRWNIITSYEHNFYHTGNTEYETYYPLTEALNFTTYYDIKFLSAGFDYTFLFGEESAHRVRPHVFSTIRFPDVGFIDEISLIPSVSLLFGNQNIYYVDGNYQALWLLYKRLGRVRFLRLYRERPDLINALLPAEGFNNVFGLMNYSLSLPVNFKIGDFSLSTGYFLNIPVALPGETIDDSPNHYFNVMALYFIPFRKRN
jgi:hypothetical protein